MTKETGGPAFPVVVAATVKHEGVTVRDYFAAQAMAGFNRLVVDYGWDEHIIAAEAEQAYRIADAMLAERSKP